MMKLKPYVLRQVIEHLNSGEIDTLQNSKNRKMIRIIAPWKEAFFILKTLWGFYPTSKHSDIVAQNIINFPNVEHVEKFIAHGINMEIKTKTIIIAILFRSHKAAKYLDCINYAKSALNQLPPIQVVSKINILGDNRHNEECEHQIGIFPEHKRVISVVNITDKELNLILT